MKKVSVIVPVYNEQIHLQEVIRRLFAIRSSLPADLDIVIVDDGSSDKTRHILSHYEGQQGIQIHYLPRNFGKGYAIREGIKHAEGEIILIQDADLEYSIDDYPALLEPLLSGEAEVVYGSRFRGRISNMKLMNFLFNKLISALVNFIFGSKITDEATAYKAAHASLLKSLELSSDRFNICPEITAKLLKRGVRIHEVPVQYRARKKSEGKKIGWSDAFSAIYTLIKFRFVD